jgi:cation transport ATPase
MEFRRNGTMSMWKGKKVLLLQLILAFVLAFCLYMLYAFMDAGSDGPFSFLIAVVTGAFFSFLSVSICLLLGLPIRIHGGLKRWWTKSYAIPLLMIMGGLFCVALSLAPANMDRVTMPGDPNNMQKWIPDVQFTLIGWFTTIFGVLHTFMPIRAGREAGQVATQPDN